MAESKSSPLNPYVTTVNENDPMVKRVPFDKMDIAANSASMPKGMPDSPGQIEHVGGGKK